MSSFSTSPSSPDQNICKFWEFESIPTKTFLSLVEQKLVSLPFRTSRPDLGDTDAQAYKCLTYSTLYSHYAEFMTNYVKNDHMSLISNSEPRPKLLHYLPHHNVRRPDRCSIKISAVLNASTKESK